MELLVTEPGGLRRVPLDKPSLILGRFPPSDVILEDRLVSRQHARMYRDPFGRWILDDIGSRNGIWFDGQRITSRVMAVGERFLIGPFVLSLCAVQERQLGGDMTMGNSLLAEDSSGEDMFTTRTDSDQNITGRRLRELNFITDRLAEVASSRDLYGEACRRTARTPEEASLVLRLHRAGPDAQKPPGILAYHRGGASPSDDLAHAADFRVSRGVVEAVRRTPQPVQASNVRFSDSHLLLTIANQDKPRAVLCVPIVVEDEWADVLYLDVPSEQGGVDTLDFARAVGMQIGFARKSILLAEEIARSRVLDHQLSMAREIQAGLMPRKLDLSPAVDLAVLSEPAMWVGGDHCDVWSLSDGRIAFVVGDVSGKGLPAAMVMTNLQAALRTALDFCQDPATALTHVSRHLELHMPAGTFVTLFLGLLDAQTGRLEYVNAGHPQPLTMTSGRVAPLGVPQNMPLGIMPGSYVTAWADIAPGDAMVAVTDGVTEARSPQKDEFGDQRLGTLLEAMPSSPCGELVEAIAKAVREFRGSLPQQDDMTILAFRWRG